MIIPRSAWTAGYRVDREGETVRSVLKGENHQIIFEIINLNLPPSDQLTTVNVIGDVHGLLFMDAPRFELPYIASRRAQSKYPCRFPHRSVNPPGANAKARLHATEPGSSSSNLENGINSR